MTSPVGRSVRVIDAVPRVTGSLDYVLNKELPGMAHGRIKRSHHPHARVVSIDLSKARALPGVYAAISSDDLPKSVRPSYGRFLLDQSLFTDGKVRYAGEPIAAVAAASEEIAREACDLIEVEYEPLPAVFTVEDALSDGAPLLHDPRPQERPETPHKFTSPEGPSNICSDFRIRHGSVDEAFEQSEYVLEEVFTTPAVQHVSLEPHVSLASFDGRLAIWSSTQMPHAVRAQMAELFEMPFSSVRVLTSNVGGGFGGKGSLRLEPIAAALAMTAGRPVKVVLDRDEEFSTVTRHASRILIKSGVASDGTLLAREVVAHYNTGAYADTGPMVARNAGSAICGPYRIPNISIDSYSVWTNLVPAGAFRGFGVVQGAWAYESHTDSIAKSIGMEPTEFRMMNLLRSGDRYFTGEIMKDLHFEELIREVSDSLEKASASEGREIAESDTKRRGRAITTTMKATITPSTSSASLRVHQDGSVHVLTSSVDLGQGVKTVLAQLAAEHMHVPYESVQVSMPDTDSTPYDQQTSSSRSTFSMGNAVLQAATDARRQLIEIAAQQLEASIDDLVFVEGGIEVRGVPSSRRSYAEIIARERSGDILGSASFVTKGGLDPKSGKGVASVHWHHGAVGCEVEVDTDTGKLEVLALVSSVFAGRVINPRLAELQVEGNLLFGVGQALFEEIVFDQGQITNANLADYLIPSFDDMPAKMEAILVEGGDGEIHGVGETSLPPVSPAISNALAEAIGVRVTGLPISPESVLRHIEDGEPVLNKRKLDPEVVG